MKLYNNYTELKSYAILNEAEELNGNVDVLKQQKLIDSINKEAKKSIEIVKTKDEMSYEFLIKRIIADIDYQRSIIAEYLPKSEKLVNSNIERFKSTESQLSKDDVKIKVDIQKHLSVLERCIIKFNQSYFSSNATKFTQAELKVMAAQNPIEELYNTFSNKKEIDSFYRKFSMYQKQLNKLSKDVKDEFSSYSYDDFDSVGQKNDIKMGCLIKLNADLNKRIQLANKKAEEYIKKFESKFSDGKGVANSVRQSLGEKL